jgi:hypothetical protein
MKAEVSFGVVNFSWQLAELVLADAGPEHEASQPVRDPICCRFHGFHAANAERINSLAQRE